MRLLHWQEAFSVFKLRSSYYWVLPTQGELYNKMIETWKLNILWTNWNVELKFPGMKHDFLNILYLILKTQNGLAKLVFTTTRKCLLWLENCIALSQFGLVWTGIGLRTCHNVISKAKQIFFTSDSKYLILRIVNTI